MLSQLWYSGLSASGLVSLTRRLRRGGVILGYHNVVAAHAEPVPGDPGLHASSEEFERQIQWLRDRCEIVSLREMANRFDTEGTASGTAAITFDDGYAGALQIAWPILRELDIPATVFVVARAPGNLPGFWWDHPQVIAADRSRRHWLVDMRGDQEEIVPEGNPLSLPRSLRPASWERLRAAVHEGLDIGCHSASHRTLIRLDDDDLRDEIEGSREIIREHLRVTPEWFSYPFGAWDSRVRDAVRHAGYRGAVTLDCGLNTRATDRWSLRRINIPASIPLPAFDAWSA